MLSIKNKTLVPLQIPDDTHSYPEVLNGHQVLVTPLKESKENYAGWVQGVDGDKVYVKFGET